MALAACASLGDKCNYAILLGWVSVTQCCDFDELKTLSVQQMIRCTVVSAVSVDTGTCVTRSFPCQVLEANIRKAQLTI